MERLRVGLGKSWVMACKRVVVSAPRCFHVERKRVSVGEYITRVWVVGW